jgi:hypothetical protein
LELNLLKIKCLKALVLHLLINLQFRLLLSKRILLQRELKEKERGLLKMLLLDQYQQLHQVNQTQLLLNPNLLKLYNQIRHNSSPSLLVYLHQTFKEVHRLLLMLRTCNGNKCNLEHRFSRPTHPWLVIISTNLSKFYQMVRKCLNNKESLQIYKETSRTSLDNMELNLGKQEPNLQKELDLKELKSKLEV